MVNGDFACVSWNQAAALREARISWAWHKLKALYAPRLQACLDELDRHLADAQATRPEGGFFLSVTFPEGIDTAKVREKAKARNLNLASGEAFFPSGGGDRFLRLPYCALTPNEIAEGIKRLAETVSEVR